MGRTFEALKRAESERKISVDEAEVFQRKVIPRRKAIERRPSSTRSTEEYTRLRQSIISLTPLLESRVLLFVGSVPNERSSRVLVDFALAVAALGERVVLVDADFRNPVFHQTFGFEKSPGVAELLLDKHGLKEVMRKTDSPNLRVITAGTSLSNPFPLLESATLNGLTAEMKCEADWVLLNAPPVTACSDAIALSKMVDGVVLVVQAEKTRWEVARDVKDRLTDAGANVLGVVLNDRRFHIPGWIYRRL
jgi:capsular exopolysaccharide synthesis family protein